MNPSKLEPVVTFKPIRPKNHKSGSRIDLYGDTGPEGVKDLCAPNRFQYQCSVVLPCRDGHITVFWGDIFPLSAAEGTLIKISGSNLATAGRHFYRPEGISILQVDYAITSLIQRIQNLFQKPSCKRAQEVILKKLEDFHDEGPGGPAQTRYLKVTRPILDFDSEHYRLAPRRVQFSHATILLDNAKRIKLTPFSYRVENAPTQKHSGLLVVFKDNTTPELEFKISLPSNSTPLFKKRLKRLMPDMPNFPSSGAVLAYMHQHLPGSTKREIQILHPFKAKIAIGERVGIVMLTSRYGKQVKKAFTFKRNEGSRILEAVASSTSHRSLIQNIGRITGLR